MINSKHSDQGVVWLRAFGAHCCNVIPVMLSPKRCMNVYKKVYRCLFNYPPSCYRYIAFYLNKLFSSAFSSVFQSSKVLAKKELASMPIIGWMWYFLEIVFCTRKWEEDRKNVVEALLNLRDYPENFWVKHLAVE